MRINRFSIIATILIAGILSLYGSAWADSVTDHDVKGYQLLQAGKYQDAIKEFQAAIALNASDIRGYVGLSRAYQQSGNLTEAIRQMRKAVALNPSVADFQIILGEQLVQANQNDEAIRTFKAARELNDEASQPLLGIAEAYAGKKDYRRAVKYAIRAMGFSPGSADIHNTLSQLYAQENRMDMAVAEAQAALRLDNSAGNKIYLAAVLVQAKNYSEAEPLLKAALAADPKSVDALTEMAEMDQGLHHNKAAIQLYRQAIKLSPKQASLWGNMGWSQYLLGDYLDAVSSSNRALVLDPTLTYVRYNLGLICAVQGDLPHAMDYYEQALKASGQDDIQAGIHDLTNALKKFPSQPALQYTIAVLLKAKGEKTQAVEHYRDFLKAQSQGQWADAARKALGEESR